MVTKLELAESRALNGSCKCLVTSVTLNPTLQIILHVLTSYSPVSKESPER